MEEKKRKVIKIGLVGLPNTGKSQTFNTLTKKYTLVANYPNTTIAMKKAQCHIGERVCEVIDSPGLHSLFIHSVEEIAVREMIFNEKPDILIQCIDANQLKQSLMLTADLLELEIPMILSLNAVAETAQKGIEIDSQKLSKHLGIPVITLLNLHDNSKVKLERALAELSGTPHLLSYGIKLEDKISNIISLFPDGLTYKRKKAILLLEKDPFIFKTLAKEGIEGGKQKLKQSISNSSEPPIANLSRIFQKKRTAWVDSIFESVVKKYPSEPNRLLQSFAHYSRHPIFGFPILTMFMFITYFLVVYVAGFLDLVLSKIILDPTTTGINSILPNGFWNEILIGHFGIITMGLFNAVVTVLPILSVFFLMFAFLEDIGYLPNLCVLVKKIFEKFGLTGNSMMPLILGFGCKTMATLITKGLSSKKEQFIAVYLIAFAIPCSAQLGINLGIVGRIGIGAFFITLFLLIFIEMIAGLLLNVIIKEKHAKNYYIQELPPIRLPSFRAIVTKTYFRLLWFLKEALPIFMISALSLFIMDKTGILDSTKILLAPLVVTWLGLPTDMVEVFILCIARREVAAGVLINLVDAGKLNYIQCIVAVIITTISFPCFANITVIGKILGIKNALLVIGTILISSLLYGGLINLLLHLILGDVVL